MSSIKKILTFCAMMCVYLVHGQNLLHGVYLNPAIGFFRLTTDKANINNTPLMLDGKIGIRVGKKDGMGLQFSDISHSVPISGTSSLQPGGGGPIWTRHGILVHKLTAIGVFYERFILLGKHLNFFPSAYAQYIHYLDEESGYIVAGSDSSITYKSGTLHKYIGRVGVNLNFQYDVTRSISLTLRFAQIDCRIWNKNEQNVFLELPVLIGVRYLFR